MTFVADVDFLVEVYRICKEYIPQKDRQAAADQLIGSIAEYDMSDSDMLVLAGVDSYMKRAVEECIGADLDVAHDEDEEDY